jgi:hypothetical protein
MTNRNSSKFVKISTFFISHTISSVFFVVSIPVQNIEANEKKILGCAKKQTEKQPKQIEFWFVLVRTEKKN